MVQVCPLVVQTEALHQAPFSALLNADLLTFVVVPDLFVPEIKGVDPVVAKPAIFALIDGLQAPSAAARDETFVTENTRDCQVIGVCL